ncbi:extradiol ring-cleavage dioxygenase [Peribacillus deserti]|uniref:Extradiol ring-cleavage dioxygenase n=1 Tax=Peribacillus deserti TaxID=673318 RepID=A0A2N5M8F1_9BACI|nr:extradiol ring-cleavage dioxygenase [Peribacillus deserti]PLT30612.1 extradiol ring-cleavage dioxygenase [Peribacillus deserti]
MKHFTFACIVPHGSEIIPELMGSSPERMQQTRNNLNKIGEEMRKTEPDSIVLLTPHGTRINGAFSITVSERLMGNLWDNGASFSMEKKVDKELGFSIAEASKANHIPAATINYGTTEGPYSCLQLDWGAMVPLRFMPDVPVVVITPSRELSFGQHIQLGKAIREAAEKSDKRIALVASCDWSHAHDAEGPYGFNPAARKLDEEAVRLIKTNKLEEMGSFEPDFIEAAKPDGIWQTLILAGAIPVEERNVEFLSYEAPTYFGLICAFYKALF